MRILHRGCGGAPQWWPVIERCRGRVLRQPADWISWNNGSNALWLLDQPHEASRWAARAVTLQPDHPSPWRSWGNALTDLGEFVRADQAYATSLRLSDSPETAFNGSKVLLAMGEYRKGYLQAERRLDSAQWAPYRSGAFWHGWPQQRQLILWTEQGFGDGLQALRWLIPLQQCWSGDVLLEVEPCLVPLLREGLAWMDRPPTVRAKAPLAPTPSSPACHGSLLSLGALMGVDLVPEAWAGGGYLRLKGDLARRAGRRPRVGVVWASGRFLDGHVQEREYWRKSLMGSTLLALLHGLADRPIDLVNLQFGADRQEAAAWSGAFQEELPADADFLATAKAMQSLDLVISVDTAAAHLAGAMGLPVWILLPWAAEARWGRGTSTTPWYPSARLLRQPQPGDWEGLIRLALARLDLWLCSW